MKTQLSFALMLVMVLCGLSFAEAPPADLVKKMTDAIKKHCPEAVIETTEEGFTAKHKTMTYTLHSISKTGEVSKETYQREGPNYKGFILKVSLRPGKYQVAADVPQELRGPYFATFINAAPTFDGKKHYHVEFSYGSQLDAELKKAIVAVLPDARIPGH